MAEYSDQDLISCLQKYKAEAGDAKKSRMDQNKLNFEAYHLRQDWSYKTKGQSKEFLPKQSMAVEQAANFLQQGLTDINDWFKVEPQAGVSENILRVKPSTVYKLMDRQLSKTGFINVLPNAAKLGLIGSLMIAKVTGKYVNKPIYKAKTELKGLSFKKKLVRMEDKCWQLDIQLVRQEDYYPDPTGRGLYEMQDIYMDYHELLRMSEGKDAIYDKAVVEKLCSHSAGDKLQDMNKSRETGQDLASSGYRKQIKVTEIWGSILNAEGELIYENCVTSIANDQFVIQKPTPNPFWHNESPFVVCPIISVPHSVWGKALMDAPTMLNRAGNEMFNLILDGGLMAVHGIKQIKEHYLEDASQIEEGIAPGDTLRVNAQCPPGESVLTRVDTSTVPADGLNVLNLVNQEFNVAAMTNDLRMGVASFRAVKATEVAEASQTISSMFSGMARQIEGDENSGFITPLLQKSWKVIAQHLNDLDSNEVKALLTPKVATELLAMGNEELFAETVQGCKFRTFGISATLNKQKDFTKLTALLQTIAASEPMMEAFIAKYDFTKYLTELMRSLDINTYKIEADEKAGGDLSQPQAGPMEQQAPSGAPDMQSQIPQAGAAGNQGDMSAVPANTFPASRATPKG